MISVLRHLAFALGLSANPLPHDSVKVPAAFPIDWKRLIAKAAKNVCAAAAEMNLDIAYDVEIAVGRNTIESTPAEGAAHRFAIDNGAPEGERRFIRFGLDDGLLLMVLLGAANWNNVEIASLLTCERTPDTQDPSIHNLMNWFRV